MCHHRQNLQCLSKNKIFGRTNRVCNSLWPTWWIVLQAEWFSYRLHKYNRGLLQNYEMSRYKWVFLYWWSFNQSSEYHSSWLWYMTSGTPVSSLGWCGHDKLLCQVPPLDQPGVSILTVHQWQASPSQDNTWWWHHSSAVWAASVGSWAGVSARFFRLICSRGLWSLLWIHGQRHRCGIIQLWRHKLTSHVLCWHIVAL